MKQRHNSIEQGRGHRRVAIIALSFLLAALIALPGLAPIIGAIAVLVMLWGMLGRQAATPLHHDGSAHREPVLWDDGFDAA